ncbi:hypothetical protein BJY59DRAFT_91141 [Rhodotorula toruloides]
MRGCGSQQSSLVSSFLLLRRPLHPKVERFAELIPSSAEVEVDEADLVLTCVLLNMVADSFAGLALRQRRPAKRARPVRLPNSPGPSTCTSPSPSAIRFPFCRALPLPILSLALCGAKCIRATCASLPVRLAVVSREDGLAKRFLGWLDAETSHRGRICWKDLEGRLLTSALSDRLSPLQPAVSHSRRL